MRPICNEVQAPRQVGQRRPHADQTTIARLWAGVATTGTGTATHFPPIWNNVTRDVVRERRLSLVEAARVFVLVNVAIHDGLQTTQSSKFVYGLWRPVTAIREAVTDLNPATDADADPTGCRSSRRRRIRHMLATWRASGRAPRARCSSPSAPTTCRFKATWSQSGGLPDVTHDFDGFWELAEDQNMARI